MIDVKDPDRGPLGRADLAIWSEIRKAVPVPDKNVNRRRGQLYAALFARMQPTDSVVLDKPLALKAIAFAKKGGIGITVRKLDADTIGIWLGKEATS